MQLIGYARNGRSGETLDKQVNDLMDYGIEINSIYKERRSELDGERPMLGECINSLNNNDIIVVTRLNQLANSFNHLNHIKNLLIKKEAHLKVIHQEIDTLSTKNINLFNLIGVFYEFEMDLRVERQLEGIQKAKINGVKFGRKPINIIIKKQIYDLYKDGFSVGQISVKLAVGRSTIYRLLK